MRATRKKAAKRPAKTNRAPNLARQLFKATEDLTFHTARQRLIVEKTEALHKRLDQITSLSDDLIADTENLVTECSHSGNQIMAITRKLSATMAKTHPVRAIEKLERRRITRKK